MTIKNAKNSLTILLGITLIASVGIVSSATVSFAGHDWATPSWDESSHTYQCLSSITLEFADSYVDECADFGTGTDYWDNVSSSNWNLSYSSTGEVEVGGANLGTGTTIAMTTIDNNWGTIEDASIAFNNQKYFTDASQTATTSYDFISVAVHETGHLLNVGDELFTTSSPMYWTIGHDEVKRTLVSHDEAAIQGKY